MLLGCWTFSEAENTRPRRQRQRSASVFSFRHYIDMCTDVDANAGAQCPTESRRHLLGAGVSVLFVDLNVQGIPFSESDIFSPQVTHCAGKLVYLHPSHLRSHGFWAVGVWTIQ